MQWYNPVYNWQQVAQAHDRYLLEDIGAREWAFVEPQSGAMLAFKSFVQLFLCQMRHIPHMHEGCHNRGRFRAGTNHRLTFVFRHLLFHH